MNQAFKALSSFAFLCLSLPVLANQVVDRNFLTISRVEVKQVHSKDPFYDSRGIYNKDLAEQIAKPLTQADPIERAGKVIKIGRDLVALGEEVYKLVDKGRPHITTKYEPISVIAKVDGKPVDIMSTENWQTPTHASYEVNYFNNYNMNVAKFRYKVIFSYGGSFDGKGEYLTAVQVLPEYVHVWWGFDFTSSMTLGGIANLSSKENPVAEATLNIEYTLSSLMKKEARVDTVTVTGRGQIIRH